MDELPVLKRFGTVTFYDADVRMLARMPVNQRFSFTLKRHEIELRQAKGTIAADIVVVHNPAMFKFERSLDFRLLGRSVILVMHENPITAFGSPTYPYRRVFDMLGEISITPSFLLAPVSTLSRSIAEQAGLDSLLAPFDWPNLWRGRSRPATTNPRDRRGRHSRPGPEKWPDPEDFALCFPANAENHILGLDASTTFRSDRSTCFYPFGSMEPSDFLQLFDFYIYFHSAAWQESFGRCIAEAIAAGKLVITHHYLRETFGDACVYVSGADEISDIVGHYVSAPDAYVERIASGQYYLNDRYGEPAFLQNLERALAHSDFGLDQNGHVALAAPAGAN